jgi:putative transposase
MDPKIREAIGLLRHQIISPVLVENGRAQMSYFRSLEGKDFHLPGGGGTKQFKASTMKSWLYRYKKQGFPGIVPALRKDHGAFRKIDGACREKIRQLRKEWLDLSVVQFYDRCVKADVLGSPPFGVETLRRFLKQEGLFSKDAPMKARKRYEMSRFGELWVGDFMHGPEVKADANSARKRKAILMAIIDDHSRVIVGGEFGLAENTLLLEQVFKQAILQYGIPSRLYVDNGASFSSEYLSKVCANIGIGLVHSKPYDSPSRGKIERYFRTVRESFLVGFHQNTEILLSDLNEKYTTWLRTEYHHHHHNGIDSRPIDRYQASVTLYPMKRTDEESLDEFFMQSVERTVNRDSTISYRGVIYETPTMFIGKRVTLKYVQDKPNTLYLYDENGIRVGRIMPVDTVLNGMNYRPSPRDPHVPFHELSSFTDEHLNGDEK